MSVQFSVPEWAGHRLTTQNIPDTTGKVARFREGGQSVGDAFTLPVVGWSVVLILAQDQLPRLVLEPVVEEDSHGPIALGDLQAECPFLELEEVL